MPVIVAVVSACLLSPSAAAVPTPAHATSVVIFPFENTGHAGETDWLGEGLSELAIERLDGHGLTIFTREERLDALEKLGLPAYAHFSRATMLKIAAEIDADYVIFGEYSADGNHLELSARVLRVSPPKLSKAIAESGALEGLPQMGTQVAWQALCGIQDSLEDSGSCSADSAPGREFLAGAAGIRLDAFQFYVRGLTSADDETRLRDLRQAAQLQPDWDEPLLMLGRDYYAKRDCEPALQWLAKVASTGPHASEANFDAGVCYLLRNDPVRAESAFSAVHVGAQAGANGSADNPAVASNLGAALLRQARYKEAIADFERALRLDPGEPDYEFNEGLGKYLTGDWPAASEALREALRLEPNDAQIKALLIVSLDHSGNADEASALRAQGAVSPPPAGSQDAAKDATPPRRDMAKLDPTSLARLARVRMVFSSGAAQ